MVMPRQDCPVCGNFPRVFRERERETTILLQQAQIESLKLELEKAHERIAELAKQIAS